MATIIKKNIPSYVDEFIYKLQDWIVRNEWQTTNTDDVLGILEKVYHSLVFCLTYHGIHWVEAESLWLKRKGASPEVDMLVPSNERYKSKLQGVQIDDKLPKPPSHLVADLFGIIYSNRQREKCLFNFYTSLSEGNYFRPKVLCDGKLFAYPDSTASLVRSSAVNVASDFATRRMYITHLLAHHSHSLIVNASPHQRSPEYDWRRIKCKSILLKGQFCRAQIVSACTQCRETFPGVQYRKIQGTCSDRFPRGNCAEFTTFSNLLLKGGIQEVNIVTPVELTTDTRDLQEKYAAMYGQFCEHLENRPRVKRGRRPDPMYSVEHPQKKFKCGKI